MTSAVLPDGIEGWSVRFRLMDTTSLMLVVRTRAALHEVEPRLRDYGNERFLAEWHYPNVMMAMATGDHDGAQRSEK